MAILLGAPYSYFADSNGAPLAGGKIYTYTAGTSTPKATYTDSTTGTPNANPVVLDSAGRAEIWLSGSYKIVVKDSLGNTIHTTDNVSSTSSAITTAVDNAFNILNSSDATKKIAFDASTITTGTTRTVIVPDANLTMVGIDTTQTLTNKSLKDSTTFIVDDGDTTKKLAFQCSGITTATTRTVTIPDKSGTMAMTSDTASSPVLLSAQTISAAASINFTGFMNSTYPMYKIFLYDVYGASAAALWCRYGISASYISTATYNSCLVGRDSAGNPETADNAGGTKIIMSGASLQATSTTPGAWEITIFNPSHSVETRIIWEGSYKSDSLARYNSHVGSGQNTGTSAITDIQFLMASGNINCVGRLYGYP